MAHRVRAEGAARNGDVEAHPIEVPAPRRDEAPAALRPAVRVHLEYYRLAVVHETAAGAVVARPLRLLFRRRQRRRRLRRGCGRCRRRRLHRRRRCGRCCRRYILLSGIGGIGGVGGISAVAGISGVGGGVRVGRRCAWRRWRLARRRQQGRRRGGGRRVEAIVPQ